MDELDVIHLELSDACQQLRVHLAITDKWEKKWSPEVQVRLDHYVGLLLANEINMLPCKRNRAIHVAEIILKRDLKLAENDAIRAPLIKKVLEIFKPQIINSELNVDYYHFSQQWLDIFLPLLAEKKRKQSKKDKKVLTLNDLKRDKSILLSNETLQRIIDEAPLITNMWSRVVSCIIALPEDLPV